MIGIGLYGTNGHQLPFSLPAAVRGRVVAVAALPADKVTEGVRRYDTLEALLADPGVELVSLCSPRRSTQAEDALCCLEAGKHVLAEKPAAFSEADLARLQDASARTGKQWREMNDSMMEPAVRAIRWLVESGVLGTVVQVVAQKSYPWFETRPADLETDGGLTRWVGIHALRFVIAATGQRITAIAGQTTNVGHPGIAQLAGSYSCTLEGGAIASVTLNYLNPTNFGSWGNEHLRVFGTGGMAEAVDGFRRTRVYLTGQEPAELACDDLSTDYLEHYVNYLLDGTPMPTQREEELAALRACLSAQEAVATGDRVTL